MTTRGTDAQESSVIDWNARAELDPLKLRRKIEELKAKRNAKSAQVTELQRENESLRYEYENTQRLNADLKKRIGELSDEKLTLEKRFERLRRISEAVDYFHYEAEAAKRALPKLQKKVKEQRQKIVEQRKKILRLAEANKSLRGL